MAQALVESMNNERDVHSLLQVLKCVSALGLATPYCRMPVGLLGPVLTQLQILTNHPGLLFLLELSH